MDSPTEPIHCTSKYGLIVVLKRDGRDSASFELTDVEYTFGRAATCDIRIQVPTIGDMHCRMKRNSKGQMVLQNIDESGTGLNDGMLRGEEEMILRPGDVITVVERSFRYENPHFTTLFPEDVKAVAPGTPSKALGAALDEIAPGSAQKTPRRLLQQQVQSPAKTGDLFSVTPSNGTPFRAEGDLTASSPNKFKVTPLKLQEETPKGSPKAATPHCTPLPATSKLAQSPINRTPSGSTLGSAQKTPRTPRATVPGSPTVVDSEIVASPKFGRGELYEYPKTSLSTEAINQEDLVEIASATPCATKTVDMAQPTLASPFKPAEAQEETLIDVEVAPAPQPSLEPVANLMDIDVAPITTCPITEHTGKPDVEQTEAVSEEMDIVQEEAKIDPSCTDACEPIVQDNQDVCPAETVEDAQAEVEDVGMKAAEAAVEDVEMTEAPVEDAEVVENIMKEHVEHVKEATEISEQAIGQPGEIVEEAHETVIESTVESVVEPVVEPIVEPIVEQIIEEVIEPSVESVQEVSATIEAFEAVCEETIEAVIESVEETTEAALEVTEAPVEVPVVESTESLVDPNVPTTEATEVATCVPAEVQANSSAAEPTPEDLALINSLQQEEMTPRRSTRQSSPFSATRLAGKKTSSGVSTPLKASSTKASLEASPMKDTEEIRYVLNVSPKVIAPSSAGRLVRKTPASTAGRRRRGSIQAEEQPAKSQSPSLRNKPSAAEEEVDAENMAPAANENENVATQSARKRGRPRKSETVNDVLTPRNKSARTN